MKAQAKHLEIKQVFFLGFGWNTSQAAVKQKNIIKKTYRHENLF
ncbi:hypothetical protein OZ410_11365 [Robiginitalea sp. M366]|nr:hypothetical protein [Robiginitalea aestuariiviva]MDG1572916.1 hypothetical protein [Robiginitalea aestuariiviva]